MKTLGVLVGLALCSFGCSSGDSGSSGNETGGGGNVGSGGTGGAASGGTGGGGGAGVCGDSVCRASEDCGSCEADCGACGGGCEGVEVLFDPNNPNIGQGCDCDLSQYDYCSGSEIIERVDLREGFTDAEFRWTFKSGGGDAYCGRFVSGDYWVAPKPGEQLSLEAVSSNGEDLGVDADPLDPTAIGVLDGGNKYGNYVASEDLTTQLPVTFASAASLVAGRKKNEALDGNCGTAAIVGACIDVYDVVSVLEGVPRNAGKNCIRPTIVGGFPKVPKCLDTDFVEERLASNPNFDANEASLARVAEVWRHATELFSNVSEGGRAYRVEGLTDDYGSGNAAAFYGALAQISSDKVSRAEKRAALGSILSYGQDYYHGFIDPSGPQLKINAGAGQSSGLAAGAYVYATLLTDPLPASQMAAMALTPDADSRPQELKQVQIRGEGSEPVWGDKETLTRYWSGVWAAKCFDGSTETCDANRGKKTVRDPYGYIDGPEGQACGSYFNVTKGPYQAFAAVQWAIPELCDVVNYDAFIRYVDRLDQRGCRTQPDPCAPPDPREVSTCNPWEAQGDDTSTFLERSGCAYYTVTWGPDPKDNTKCIANNTGGNTGQTGRYPARDGANAGFSEGGFYTSSIRSVWSAVRGAADSCRTRAAGLTMQDATLNSGPGGLDVSAPVYSNGAKPATHNAVYEVIRTTPSGSVRRVQKCSHVDVSGDPAGTSYAIRACDHVGACSPTLSYRKP